LELRAIPLVVLVQQTLDEKKSKHASLVHENGFVLALAIDWQDGLIGPGGLLLVVSNLLQPQFQFYG
jgi:hypothetical protein